MKIPLNLPLQRETFHSPLFFRRFRVFCKEVFTTEAPSSQRSENFLIKNSLLRVLRVSAV
jgi:hypothetical protein